MENQRYMQEGIDSKRIFLLIKEKIWMAVAAVIAGALLGAGVYLLIHLAFASEREYQSVSKVYLNFNCDPEDFNELAYNGYTWNDLMATDPILNYTMEELPSEIKREKVIASTKAEILSDIRLLTVTITSERPDLTARIMEATQKALVHLGETDELFHSIEIYSTTEPEQILWDNRTVNAAATGAVITFFIMCVLLVFYYILDDSVYVGTDVEKRYGIPALGVFTAKEPGTFQSFGNEFFANYTYLCKGTGKAVLMSIEEKEDAVNAERLMDKILSTGKTTEEYEFTATNLPEEEPAVYEEIRKADGVILVLRFGRRNGKRMERALSNLKKQDCRILGAVIVEADEKFLKLYYMGKKAEK